MTKRELPITIIGGGPVGLAAASYLLDSNKPFLLFEAGKSVGANILSWGHVRVFSPWKYNIDRTAEKLLTKHGIGLPDKEETPTGKRLVLDYLQPLANLPGIRENILLNTSVISVGRSGLDKVISTGRDKLPFSIQVNERGRIKTYEAKAVIDATGTWHNPNPIGSGGVFAIGELESNKQIYYGIPDVLHRAKDRYVNKTVLVVGGGHSAINSILDLNNLSTTFPLTKVHWLLRKREISQVYGGQEADGLEARGALGIRIEKLVQSGRLHIHTPVYIHEIQQRGNKLNVLGIRGKEKFELQGIDEIISNTGTRPDFSFLREVRFDADAALESVPALADLIDPNIHSCGTVRPHGEAELRQKEKDFYIVGMKSYGRAPTFLMATGYEQVRSIVAHMDGDFEGAKRVDLNLPATGVCNSGIVDSDCCVGNGCEMPSEKDSCNEKNPSESCCVQPINGTDCCYQSPPTEEIDACCTKPEDGSACCAPPHLGRGKITKKEKSSSPLVSASLHRCC